MHAQEFPPRQKNGWAIFCENGKGPPPVETRNSERGVNSALPYVGTYCFNGGQRPGRFVRSDRGRFQG